MNETQHKSMGWSSMAPLNPDPKQASNNFDLTFNTESKIEKSARTIQESPSSLQSGISQGEVNFPRSNGKLNSAKRPRGLCSSKKGASMTF